MGQMCEIDAGMGCEREYMTGVGGDGDMTCGKGYKVNGFAFRFHSV